MIEGMADTWLDPSIMERPEFEILGSVAIVALHTEFLWFGVLLFFHGLYRKLKRR